MTLTSAPRICEWLGGDGAACMLGLGRDDPRCKRLRGLRSGMAAAATAAAGERESTVFFVVVGSGCDGVGCVEWPNCVDISSLQEERNKLAG